MKNLGFKLMTALLLATLLFFNLDANVKADETYLGEFCWEVNVEEPFTDTWIYKLGVYQKEGGHYVLYGTDAGEYAVHGNAAIIGDTIALTLVASGIDEGLYDEPWTDLIKAILDTSTLSGRFHSHTTWSVPPALELEWFKGTMNFITCP